MSLGFLLPVRLLRQYMLEHCVKGAEDCGLGTLLRKILEPASVLAGKAASILSWALLFAFFPGLR